jgi:hypothetical protein
MKFQILPIVATLLAVTNAAPTSEPEPHYLVARASRCGDSTFENQVSGGSPLIRDCEQISRNIAGTSLPPSLPHNPLHQHVLTTLPQQAAEPGPWAPAASTAR